MMERENTQQGPCQWWKEKIHNRDHFNDGKRKYTTGTISMVERENTQQGPCQWWKEKIHNRDHFNDGKRKIHNRDHVNGGKIKIHNRDQFNGGKRKYTTGTISMVERENTQQEAVICTLTHTKEIKKTIGML